MSEKNYSILIVDDDAAFHQELRFAFRRNFVFEGAISPNHLMKKMTEKSDYDLILMDLVLDNETKEKIGLELVAKLTAEYPAIPVIVVTADKDLDTVVEAMKAGARDFLAKGDYDYKFWYDKFTKVIESHQLKQENTALRKEVQRHREEAQREHLFIGDSPNIQEIKRILRLVSEEPEISVLLLGETGVGKEVAARYLHAHGARRDKPFQAINLSAIQDTLLESTLFGHKKGAFTGASKDMEGYFFQANGGILMLDEIGDIDANIQIKLLRFLETKLIRPVGADKDIQLDVQVVAATHRNLEEEVRKGTFRADLYQRLKAMVVTIPPLRERKQDILAIMGHYLKGEDPKKVISPQALQLLLEYNWVGNVRELKNAINYMLLRKKILNRPIVDPDCLPVEINTYTPTTTITTDAEELTQSSYTHKELSINEEHALLDLRRIESALIARNKVKKDAAIDLGLENTDNLRYKIKKYYQKHPQLFSSFPIISAAYRRIVK